MMSASLCRHVFVVGTTLMAVAGASAAPPADNPLAAERWKTRPVVIVAPSSTDRLLTAQQDVLLLPANQSALKAREMVVYTVVGDLAERDGKPLSAAQARALRKALDVENHAPATVFLVGKDGGVKLSRREAISAQELFGTVDAMPMMRRD